MDNVKRMSISEFRAMGLLQEINRQFLNPIGLALEVVVDNETGEEHIGGLWDYRDDEEGILFDWFTDEEIERAIRVEEFRTQRALQRLKVFGFVVQPLIPRCPG